MKGKSPMMKALVGNQKNLNEGLKAAIKAAPGKIMEKTPMNMKMESAVKIGMAKKPAPMKIKKPAPMKVAKPDFPDIDGDGDRKESISKAAADKKAKSPAKKSTRVSDKEKAAMMAKKRAAGTDAASMRRKELSKEVRKQLRGKSVFGAAGKEAEKKAVATAEKELDKKKFKSPK